MKFQDLDPRTKILWMLMLNTAILSQHSIPGLVLMTTLLLIPAVITAGRVKETTRAVIGMRGYLLFLAVIQTAVKILSGGGINLATVLFAVTEVTRFLIMILSATLLFATTDSTDIGRAVRMLKRGNKGRWNTIVESFAFITATSYQLVPIFLNEIEEMVQVMRGRGIGVKEGSNISQVKGLLGMTLPLFNRTLEILKNSIIAILNYGYDPSQPRTQLIVLHAHPMDFLVTLYVIAITLAFMLLPVHKVLGI